MNLEAIVGKFGNVFIIAKEEEHKFIPFKCNRCNNDVKATTKLLNIARTFQATFPITPSMFDSPSSTMFHYYDEMLDSFATTINDHEKDLLVVNLEDVIPQLDNFIIK